MKYSESQVNVVLPAKNEAISLGILLPKLLKIFPVGGILVVNDGSDDNTIEVCEKYGVKVINHPYCKGNGAAIKSGAREVGSDVIIFMDADGQHDPNDIPALVDEIVSGADMVVGSRSSASQASAGRRVANAIYNKFASWMTGHRIEDLTSGFRAVRRERFQEFMYMLPNGFSYPTTITMAMFRAGHTVKYVPIHASNRVGKSHVKLLSDGIRFLLIIFRVGTLFSPLRIFFPTSLVFFILGCGHYAYSFANSGRFTNMDALLFITFVLVFLLGLISEQITNLLYRHH